METSQISPAVTVREKNFGDAVAGETLLCRLCGSYDSSRMLHLSDIYCVGMSATSSIFHLLDNISALLKVQEECEESMPKHVCVACFNTAVDIQAFVDSAVNFQKSTICQLYPNAKLEEVQDLTFATPSQHYFQATNNFFQSGNVEHCNQQPDNKLFPKCCPADIVDSQEQHSAKSIQVKVELIDPDVDPSKTSAETVIEISPSVEQQVCRVTRSSSNGNEPNKSVSVAEYAETLKEQEENIGCKAVYKNDDTKASNEKPATITAQESVPFKSGGKRCPTCGKTFSRPSQLKSHLMSHTEARPFECSVCSMRFKYRRNLVEHSRVHDDPPSFICSVCGLTFKQQSNLLKHERTHQKIYRLRLRCNICNKQYSQSSHLKTHMRNKHGDNQGYTCNQCNAVLHSQSSLRRHAATVHASSSKFLCPHCNKGFNNSQNYQGHLRSHTGERPYSCSTCNKTFSTSKALSRHRLIHQGIKSHKCSQCGKAFLELCDLKRHVKRHLLKQIKNASKSMARKYQDGTNLPVQSVAAGMNLSLMVLPESLLFTESQQLLDNSGSSTNEIILPHDKLNTVKTVSAGPVLETGLLENTDYNIQPDTGPLSKESHILRPEGEILEPSELLPAPPVSSAQEVESVPILDNTSVLQHHKVISNITTSSLHSSSVLQSDSIGVDETLSHANSNCDTCEPTECRTDSESATMVVLSSVGTTSDYLPVANSDAVIEGTRCQQSERVLSHATW